MALYVDDIRRELSNAAQAQGMNSFSRDYLSDYGQQTSSGRYENSAYGVCQFIMYGHYTVNMDGFEANSYSLKREGWKIDATYEDGADSRCPRIRIDFSLNDAILSSQYVFSSLEREYQYRDFIQRIDSVYLKLSVCDTKAAITYQDASLGSYTSNIDTYSTENLLKEVNKRSKSIIDSIDEREELVVEEEDIEELFLKLAIDNTK